MNPLYLARALLHVNIYWQENQVTSLTHCMAVYITDAFRKLTIVFLETDTQVNNTVAGDSFKVPPACC